MPKLTQEAGIRPGWPSKERIRIIRKAARDLRFLIGRGYRRSSAITFVGDHYQLTKKERHMLFRAVFPGPVATRRKKKRVGPRRIEGKDLIVDGYNCFITLESALKGLPIIRCDDGFIRDVSGIFKRFRPDKKTQQAWSLMERVFRIHRPKTIKFFLDAPYSNSASFCRQIGSWLEAAGLEGTCRLSEKSERLIASPSEIVVTADSVIIDSCEKVFDLTGHITARVLRIRPLCL